MTSPGTDATSAYSDRAQEYTDLACDDLVGRPDEAIIIERFVAIASSTRRAILDVGCGPGHITESLGAGGATTIGVDGARGMLDIARRASPTRPLIAAALAQLPVADGSVGGLYARHSTIHTPPDELGGVLQEFVRVLATGAGLLLTFSVAEPERHGEQWAHAVAPAYRCSPEWIVQRLQRQGLRIETLTTLHGKRSDRFPHASVLASRPRPTAGRRR